MAESHRNFDGDLQLVFSKLSIADANVLNVYLIGSRMWGTASNSSDHDLYIVIKGNESARNSHFKIPGFEIDAVVVGMAYFQSRLDSGKLKELSCLWAPQSCKLLERHAFRVAGNQVDRAALLKSLHEGHEKDWRRARKLVESGRVSEGKKVLLHDLRAHLLAVQIVREGKIVDYEAGHEVHDWINYTFSKSWDVFAAEFEPKIASLLDFLRNVNAGESASAPMELQSLTISKQGRSDYWFGDDLSPSRITRRQISADADEAAVSTLEDRLRLAADETRNDDSKLDKLKRIMAEALEQGLTEESSAVKYAQGAIDECAAYRKRAADSRKEEVQITNYPSTPHLPFSPTVHSDDIQVRLYQRPFCAFAVAVRYFFLSQTQLPKYSSFSLSSVDASCQPFSSERRSCSHRKTGWRQLLSPQRRSLRPNAFGANNQQLVLAYKNETVLVCVGALPEASQNFWGEHGGWKTSLFVSMQLRSRSNFVRQM